MDAFICTTCGTQFAPCPQPPEACAICTEERQFVNATGQAWTTLERLGRSHMPIFRYEAELLGVGITPNFGINQRALLVRTPAGNILWDCVSLVDPAIVDIINGLGGLSAIAISHPHYYTTMLEWSRLFGNIPVHLHEADREWIMRDGDALQLWSGDTKAIAPGLNLIRVGGHFEGGTIMHWAAGAQGRGAILAGDILQVVADRRHLGFMRSYPNFIPLGAAAVRDIAERMQPWAFDAIYGAFWNLVIPADGKRALQTSITRHIDWVERGVVLPAPRQS